MCLVRSERVVLGMLRVGRLVGYVGEKMEAKKHGTVIASSPPAMVPVGQIGFRV